MGHKRHINGHKRAIKGNKSTLSGDKDAIRRRTPGQSILAIKMPLYLWDERLLLRSI